jgi:hypothetical protein
MRIESLTISDFYNDVDDVRQFALQQEFKVRGNFPGPRTESFLNDSIKGVIQNSMQSFAGNITWWGEYSGSFQYTTAGDRSWIHSDATTEWAGVCYLTPDAPLSAGTGLFRLKENGLREWRYRDHTEEENQNALHNRFAQDYTKWEMDDRFGNIYNRLIIYRGDLYHVSLDYFGTNMHDGRLFQVFFFNTER